MRGTNAYATVDPEQLLQRADALEDPNRAAGFRVYAAYVAALKLVYPDTVFDDKFILLSSGPRRGTTGRESHRADFILAEHDDPERRFA